MKPLHGKVSRRNCQLTVFTLLIVYGKEIHLKTNMFSHLSKVLGNVKNIPIQGSKLL
jgi:hypothetical protein